MSDAPEPATNLLLGQALQRISREVRRVGQAGFLPALLEHLAETLGVECTFVARHLEDRPGWAGTIGSWRRSLAGLEPTVEYPLQGTPCAAVAHGETVCISEGLCARFPEDTYLEVGGYEAYAAVPMMDGQGRWIGHLGLLHTAPLPDCEPLVAVLEVLAPLAALEVARQGTITRLEAQDRRFAAFLENAPFGAFFYERRPSGRVEIAGVNPASRRYAVVDTDALVGSTCLEAFPYLEGGPIPGMIEQAAAGGGPFFTPSYRVFAEGRAWVFELHTFSIGPARAAILFYDLSAREQAEGALRESEQRLQLVLEHAPFGADFWALGEDGVLRFEGTNAAGDRILGVDRTAMIGQPMDVVLPGLAGTPAMELYHAVTRGERGPYHEPRYPYEAAGITGVFEVHAFRIGPGRMVGLYRDVTAQVRAEEAERAAARLEATATLAGGIAHDVNNLMSAILGHVALLSREPAEARSERLEQVALAAKGATALAQQLLSYARGGKYDVRPTDVNAVVGEVLKRLRGSLPAGVRLSPRLADDLQRIEADRSQLRQMVRALVINAVEASVAVGSTAPLEVTVETQPTYLTPEQAAALQLEPGEYVVFKVCDQGLGMAEGVVSRVFEPYFSTKGAGRGMGLAAVYGVVKNHGGAVRVESTPGVGTTFEVLLPVRESRGTFSAKELTGAVEVDGSDPGVPEHLSRLALEVAHDLNNLLAVAFNALHEREHEDVALRQALLGCRELAYRLLTLGGLGQERVLVSPNAVAEAAAQLIRPLLPPRARLRLELAPDLPPLSAVRARLENALLNLCLNSRDALPPGGGEIVIATERRPGDERVSLRVSDTGCGMSPEIQARLTEPFFSTKSARQGLGLGLPLVDEVVRDHGGELQIRSRMGEGTEITLLLPVAEARAAEPAASVASPAPPIAGRVLVVDDQEHVSRSTARMLELEGYTVAVARTGEEALRQVEEADPPFAVIVLDLVLPGMGGAEVLEAVRALRPDQPVVICSGFGRESEVRQLLQRGAVFLPKPFLYDDLMAKVRAAIEATRGEEPARASDPNRDDETKQMRHPSGRTKRPEA